jgi:hypothetical protein
MWLCVVWVDVWMMKREKRVNGEERGEGRGEIPREGQTKRLAKIENQKIYRHRDHDNGAAITVTLTLLSRPNITLRSSS